MVLRGELRIRSEHLLCVLFQVGEPRIGRAGLEPEELLFDAMLARSTEIAGAAQLEVDLGQLFAGRELGERDEAFAGEPSSGSPCRRMHLPGTAPRPTRPRS